MVQLQMKQMHNNLHTKSKYPNKFPSLLPDGMLLCLKTNAPTQRLISKFYLLFNYFADDFLRQL